LIVLVVVAMSVCSMFVGKGATYCFSSGILLVGQCLVRKYFDGFAIDG